MKNETKEPYSKNLNYIKCKIFCEPRVITTDSNLAQIWTIKQVFPSSFIVYCSLNIRKDLLKYFSKFDNIF